MSFKVGDIVRDGYAVGGLAAKDYANNRFDDVALREGVS